MVYSNNAALLGLKTGMELRFLLLLLLLFYVSGFQAQEDEAAESRAEGQDLSLECHYDAQDYSYTRKTWCKMRNEICSPLVSTYYTSILHSYQNRNTFGRATIQDDTRNGIVTITMKKLQVQDSGVYWCARYYPPNTVYTLKAIKLDVYKVREYTAMEGQNLSVQCPYNTQDYKEAKKTWCRRRAQNKCDGLVNTDDRSPSYQNKAQKGRFTIQDDTQKGVVSITMEKLKMDDSGVYWCELYDPPYSYRIIIVKLDVTKAPTTSDVPVTPSTGHTSPVLSTASAELSTTDSGQHQTKSTFIILGVVLGLLFILALIGLMVLCIWKSRQPKSKGDGQAEDIYEEPRNAPARFHNMKDPKDDKKEMPQDLNYVTLDFKSRSSPKDSVYANIVASQALEPPHTRSPSEPVEYARISLKPLASAAQQ